MKFELGQRVVITRHDRYLARAGADADFLRGTAGVVQELARENEGAWVRIDEQLPASLQAGYPATHVRGRNLLLFPWECEPTSANAFAPFHRDEFDAILDEVRSAVNHVHLGHTTAASMPRAGVKADECWWRDATMQLSRAHDTPLRELVYRVGIGSRPITLLVFSTVGRASLWSRRSSQDGIRFVYERRRLDAVAFQRADVRVNRTGSAPLERVRDRVVELLDPAAVGPAARRDWFPSLTGQ